MNNRSGKDPIWWAASWKELIDKRGGGLPADQPWHFCPLNVLTTRVTRDMLDPLALGVCRYCSAVLPGGPAPMPIRFYP